MTALEARPEDITIDPKRTALIVVDMQNDFGSPGGMFDRAGIDISGIEAATEAARGALRTARAAGIPIVYLKMEHPADLANIGPEDGPHCIKHRPLGVGDEVRAPDGSPGRILVRDTWNTDIVDALGPNRATASSPSTAIAASSRPSWTTCSRVSALVPLGHRLHDERLRRVHGSRRDVQGLFVHRARGLHGRADRLRLSHARTTRRR